MSLSFAQATTNKVTITNPLSIVSGSAWTSVYWLKCNNAAPTNGMGANKGAIDWLVFFTSGYFQYVPRATTASQSKVAQSVLFPSLTEWVYCVVTYGETNGVKIYRGSRTTTAAEVTYLTNTVGAGATTADSGDLYLFNRIAGSLNALPFDMAFYALYDTAFTVGEARKHQWIQRPIKSGCKVLFNVGSSGSSTQVDLSGNLKNSTITGATIAAHAPFRAHSA